MSKLSNYIYKLFLFSILFFGTCMTIFGQSLLELKNNKQKIERDIKYLNKLLEQGESTKKSTYSKIIIVSKQISNRENLIINTEKEVIALSNLINKNYNLISNQSSKLEALNRQYASIIYSSWLHKSNKNKFVFILSSNDFNQAYLRLKYLRQYSYYTQKLVSDINIIKTDLSKKNESLIENLKEKEVLVKSINDEKLSLAKEKQKYGDYISQLQLKEQDIRKKLNNQLKLQNQLEDKIKEVIALEAKSIQKRTQSEINLSNDFTKNKGVLPWPTKTGFISSSYGVHSHPIAKKTKVRNDGIDITTEPNSDCYSIFTGIVSEVFNFPGLNNIVMIRHGDYLTVYANLSKVYVRKGEKVKTSQVIGMIYTDLEEKRTILKFQVWKNNLKQNPVNWLSK